MDTATVSIDMHVQRGSFEHHEHSSKSRDNDSDSRTSTPPSEFNMLHHSK